MFVKVPTVGLVYTMWVYHDMVWALNILLRKLRACRHVLGYFVAKFIVTDRESEYCGAVTHYRSCDPYSKELGI